MGLSIEAFRFYQFFACACCRTGPLGSQRVTRDVTEVYLEVVNCLDVVLKLLVGALLKTPAPALQSAYLSLVDFNGFSDAEVYVDSKWQTRGTLTPLNQAACSWQR